MTNYKSILCVFLLFPLIFSSRHLVAHDGGFHVDLIHRDHSPMSPFYNSSLSHSDRLVTAAHRSTMRYKKTAESGTFQSIVVPELYPDYLAEMNVGTPAIKVHAMLDTGSDLIWTQCSPCIECYEQFDKVYDRRKSSTYLDIPCESDACSLVPNRVRDCESKKCSYNYSYVSKSYTHGLLSRETFSFQSTEGHGKVVVPNLMFGCSLEAKPFDMYISGFVGLGGGPLSLVSQVGYRFSYCLTPTGEDSGSGFLYFGGVFSGSRTVSKMISCYGASTFYCLSLEKVVVGQNFSVAEPSPIIVDSGSTLTYLSDDLLLPIISYLKQVVMLPFLEDYFSNYDACFNASTPNYLFSDMPGFYFVFSSGPIWLSPMNSFVELNMLNGKVVCLAMASSRKSGGRSVFGNIAQHNFLVGYDIKERQIYFEQADCRRPPSSVNWTLHGTGACLLTHIILVLELLVLDLMIIF